MILLNKCFNTWLILRRPCMCACMLSCFSPVWLCDPVDCSLPGFSVHGILQARILEWLPCPPPGDLPNPGIKPMFVRSPALAGGFFITGTSWEAREDHVYTYSWYVLINLSPWLFRQTISHKLLWIIVDWVLSPFVFYTFSNCCP